MSGREGGVVLRFLGAFPGPGDPPAGTSQSPCSGGRLGPFATGGESLSFAPPGAPFTMSPSRIPLKHYPCLYVFSLQEKAQPEGRRMSAVQGGFAFGERRRRAAHAGRRRPGEPPSPARTSGRTPFDGWAGGRRFPILKRIDVRDPDGRRCSRRRHPPTKLKEEIERRPSGTRRECGRAAAARGIPAPEACAAAASEKEGTRVMERRKKP